MGRRMRMMVRLMLMKRRRIWRVMVRIMIG